MPPRTGSRSARPWVFGLILLTALVGLDRGFLVLRSLPYPGHEDDAFLTHTATGMIQRADLNPQFFRYPTLPIYLTAASASLAMAVEGVGPAELEGGWRPFYDHPGVWAAPRLLFATLSLLMFPLVGWAATSAFGRPALWLLAPLLLCASSFTQWMSWSYLNVDILAATSALAAIGFALHSWQRSITPRSSAIGGALCAVATACKYTMGITLLAFGLHVLLEGDHKWQRALALVITFALVFVALVPYSVLDPSTFLEDIRAEAEHYRLGHTGAEGPVGVPQFLWYQERMIEDNGLVLFVAGWIGIGAALYCRRRGALPLVVVPMALLLVLSANRVHFQRNILLVHLLWPVLAAGLLSELGELLRDWTSWRGDRLLSGLPALAALAFAPWPELGRAYLPERDSRHEVLAWLNSRSPPGVVVYPRQMAIDLRSLEPEWTLFSYDRTCEIDPLGGAGQRPTYLLTTDFDVTQATAESAAVRTQWLDCQSELAGLLDGAEVARFGSTAVHADYVFPARFDPIVRVLK